MVQVRRRDFIHRELTPIDAPLREIGTHHFVRMLRESFVIFLQGGVQRQQMAPVRVRHDDQFAGTFRTPAGVTEFNLLLIASALFHFEGG